MIQFGTFVYYIIRKMLDLFLPNRCLYCNRIISGKELVCVLCYGHISFTHYQYGDDHSFNERCKLLFPVENAFALMHFEKENLSRKIIHTLKYKNREIVGKILADWTDERLNLFVDKPDLLVTVPLHPKKLRQRGYNQLHLFADTLSEKFGIPHYPDFLVRTKYTGAQALKDKEHRAENSDIFKVNHQITNKHIMLIDDVFTTGNTIASIAWKILKEGNNRISILVMALDG